MNYSKIVMYVQCYINVLFVFNFEDSKTKKLKTRTLENSKTQKLEMSKARKFENSKTRKLENSKTQKSKNSKLKNSKTRKLENLEPFDFQKNQDDQTLNPSTLKRDLHS